MDRERELHHHPSWTISIISKKSIFNDTQPILIGIDESVQSHKRFPSTSGLISLLFIEPLQEKTKNDMIAAYWIDISHHRDFFYVTISRFFYYMGISSQTFFLYFIHDEIQHNIETPKATVALLAIVGQCAGAFTCLPIGIVSDKYFGGQRKIFVYISCIFLAVGNVLLLFCKQLVHMILVCVLLGAANGIYLTMDTSLAVDTLDSDKDEAQDVASDASNEGVAQLLGVWGVFGFIGSASGPLIGGLALLFFGRDADATKFYSQRGYEYLFVLSAFYFLCSACTLAFVQKKGV
jgi:MFS family permease